MHGVCVWMRSVLTFVQEDSCVWLAVLFRRVMCMCVCVCTSTYTHTCVCVCGCANEYVDVSCMCLISLQHVIVCAFECLCLAGCDGICACPHSSCVFLYHMFIFYMCVCVGNEQKGISGWIEKKCWVLRAPSWAATSSSSTMLA